MQAIKDKKKKVPNKVYEDSPDIVKKRRRIEKLIESMRSQSA